MEDKMVKTKKVTIQNILYTTDLSDTSMRAFSYAASLANSYGATLTILHVIEGSFTPEEILAAVLPEGQWQDIKERRISEARESLSGKRRDNVIMREGISQVTENIQAEGNTEPFTTDEILVVYGDDPVDKIIETSKERGSDLIVMGTHGRRGILGDLGSTTRAVLKKSRIPVLAVRLDE